LSNEDYLQLVNRYVDEIVHFDLLSIGIEQLNLFDEETKTLFLGTLLENMQDVIFTYLDN